MRRVLAMVAAAVLGVALTAGSAVAGSVEVKGVHLCCPSCQKAVGATLAKVDGVSDAKCTAKEKLVTFTATDEKTAAKAVEALAHAGFFGTCTLDGKELKIKAPKPKKGEKADVVTIEKVHVCCKRCQDGLAKIFPDATIEYDGKGTQKTVKITGKGLDKAEVMESLRKGGYNGTIAK